MNTRTALHYRLMDPEPGQEGGGGDTVVPDGTGEASWRDSLGEDLRDNPSLKDIKDISGLAKGYVHAQKALGNNVAVPGKDATDEEWGSFFNKAGRPETADKYNFDGVESPEGVGVDEGLQAKFTEQAHAMGLSQRQAAGMFGWYQGLMGEKIANDAEVWKAGMESAASELKKEYGAAYDERLQQASAAAKEFGGPELMSILEESGLGNNPTMIRALAKIGQAMANDELFGAGQETGAGRNTPAEANAEINRLQADPAFFKAYTNADDPGHADALAKMTKLFEEANAGR